MLICEVLERELRTLDSVRPEWEDEYIKKHIHKISVEMGAGITYTDSQIDKWI